MSGQNHKTVAGYHLLKQTGYDGAGGFGLGCLYEAVDSSGNLVSLKLASLKSLPEVRIKERNQHPNLVQLIGFWIVNENGEVVNPEAEALVAPALSEGCALVIATDLHIGTSSQVRQKECQSEGHAGVPCRELIRYLEDIASAVDFLTTPKFVRGLGVVTLRCDATPSNIILTPSGARLNDLHSEVYPTFQELGYGSIRSFSPRYSAPECFEGSPCNSSPAYSLAVTYYELRTGSLPFEGATTLLPDMLKARRETKLNLSALPRGERDTVEKALSVDPNERYQCCVELIRSLRGASTGTPPEAFARRTKG